jgi:hypothetical protein
MFCCGNLDQREVFLIVIFANFGTRFKFKRCLLKQTLTLHFSISCLKFVLSVDDANLTSCNSLTMSKIAIANVLMFYKFAYF